MTSTDALILSLSTGLVPVRRRSVAREATFLVILAAAELALVLGVGAMRPDMGRMLFTPHMLWKIGSLAVLAIVACSIALSSFVPPAQPRRGLKAAVALAALAVLSGSFVTSAADSGRSLIDRLSPIHGLLCSTSIIVLAVPVMIALAVLMRRGAPVFPRDTASACGFAAATSGALVFTVCCPMNDPLYIAVWYSLAVAVVTCAARWLLPRRFRL